MSEQTIMRLQKLNEAFVVAYADLQNAGRDELNALQRYARISMVGASTRIENAMLTDPEISWMDTILTTDGHPTAFAKYKEQIENKLSKDRERSIEEVAGCRAMLLEIYENHDHYVPLKEADLRGLHYLLLSHYQKAAHYVGRYKIQTNSVVEQNRATGQTRMVFQTADPGPVTQTAMADLVKWYNDHQGTQVWPLAVAAEFVYRFLAIHPFQDGNGRLGRGLMLLALLQADSAAISFVSRYLAIDRAIENHKELYYMVLNRCSDGVFKADPTQYHMEHFLNFMIKVLSEALEGLPICRARYKAQIKLPPAILQVLDCFKEHPEIRLNTTEIMNFTLLPKRTVIYALNELVEAELIQKYGAGPATKYQLTF